MREKNDVLEQALAAIAAEETRALEQQMTFSDMQAAKKLQLDNSKKNRTLIRKHTRSFRVTPYIKAAAVLAVVAGGLMLLRSPMPEKTEITSPAAPPLPYQTTASITTSPSHPLLNATIPPTLHTEYIDSEHITPTITPLVTLSPAPIPTLSPTLKPTPAPTATPTPSPVPTAVPDAATPAPQQEAQHPYGWQGRYFPEAYAAQWSIQEREDHAAAVYADNYEFMEYPQITHPPATGAEITEYQYLSVGDTPALLTKDKAGQYTLTWNADDRTLVLFSPDGEKETLLGIANSVVKLAEN